MALALISGSRFWPSFLVLDLNGTYHGGGDVGCQSSNQNNRLLQQRGGVDSLKCLGTLGQIRVTCARFRDVRHMTRCLLRFLFWFSVGSLPTDHQAILHNHHFIVSALAYEVVQKMRFELNDLHFSKFSSNKFQSQR